MRTRIVIDKHAYLGKQGEMAEDFRFDRSWRNSQGRKRRCKVWGAVCHKTHGYKDNAQVDPNKVVTRSEKNWDVRRVSTRTRLRYQQATRNSDGVNN